jgi:ACS family D-galactonate transporter-like MFS transporter
MHWRILPLMMVFVALAHFNRISITVAGAEQIIPSALISKERMGVVYTALLVVYTICMVPGGWFLDRFGPRIAWMVVVFGSAGFVTGTGLVGWCIADSSMLFAALLVVRGCLGVICAPLHPTAARLVANWTHSSATDFANGLVNAAALVGIAFTYVVFGELIDLFGWPQAFMISGGVTFVFALAWFWFGADHPPNRPLALSEQRVAHSQPPSPDGEKGEFTAHAPGPQPNSFGGEKGEFTVKPPSPRRLGPSGEWGDIALGYSAGFGRVLVNSSLLFLTLSYGLLGYFQYLFFYWAEYYFENQMHLTTQDSRWSSTLLTLAMGGGMFVGGWLSDWARRRFPGRWGLAAIPILALGIAGTATFWSLGERPASGVIAGLAIAMGSAGICEGSYWTTAVRLGRQSGGTAAAIMNTAGNAIGLLAPLLTPWISTHYGWQASLGLAAIVCWIAAISWLGVRLKDSSNSNAR